LRNQGFLVICAFVAAGSFGLVGCLGVAIFCGMMKIATIERHVMHICNDIANMS